MIIGLRVLALLVDLGLCLGLGVGLFTGLGRLAEQSEALGLAITLALFPLLLAWPILYFGLCEGLWGRTPAKFILSLRVVDGTGEKPSVPRALGRGALKLLAVGTTIGALIALIQLIWQGATWYDHLCGTMVEYRPGVRLTDAQKHFRDVYGDGR